MRTKWWLLLIVIAIWAGLASSVAAQYSYPPTPTPVSLFLPAYQPTPLTPDPLFRPWEIATPTPIPPPTATPTATRTATARPPTATPTPTYGLTWLATVQAYPQFVTPTSTPPVVYLASGACPWAGICENMLRPYIESAGGAAIIGGACDVFLGLNAAEACAQGTGFALAWIAQAETDANPLTKMLKSRVAVFILTTTSQACNLALGIG